jgi:hypothetical protein
MPLSSLLCAPSSAKLSTRRARQQPGFAVPADRLPELAGSAAEPFPRPSQGRRRLRKIGAATRRRIEQAIETMINA